MKTSFAIFSIVALIWATPALAQMRSLTDAQLDSMTAGSIPDRRGAIFADQSVDGQVTSSVDNNNVDALNVAIANESTANTSTVDNSVNRVVLAGDVPEHARAVSIVNGVGNKVGTGVNAFAVIDRGLGELNRSGASSSVIGTLPFVNQSNIIIQQR
jgi:hypothetical protein